MCREAGHSAGPQWGRTLCGGLGGTAAHDVAVQECKSPPKPRQTRMRALDTETKQAKGVALGGVAVLARKILPPANHAHSHTVVARRGERCGAYVRVGEAVFRAPKQASNKRLCPDFNNQVKLPAGSERDREFEIIIVPIHLAVTYPSQRYARR